MVSEAQKRAKKKYAKRSEIVKGVKLNKNTEKDILDFLDNSNISFSTYVKELIREDMKKRK